MPYRLLLTIELLCIIYIIFSNGIIYSLSDIFFQGRVLSEKINALKFSFTFLTIFPYCFLIGGTLPLFVKMFFDGTGGKKRDFSIVYGINTLGAAAGAFLSGFFFLNIFGVKLTMLLSSALSLSIIIIVAAIFYGRREEMRVTDEEKGAEKLSSVKVVYMMSIAVSGFVSLSCEILWIRLITPIVGSGVYTFSLVLVFYLLATSLGCLIYERMKVKDESKLIFSLNYIAGIPIILTLYLTNTLLWIYNFVFTFTGGGFFSLIISLCVLLMIITVPISALFGVHYAFVNSFMIADYKSVSHKVGNIYCINILFSVTGIAVTTFYMLPGFGLYSTFKILALAAFIFSAVIFTILKRGFIKSPAVVLLFLLALGLFAAIPGEDIKMMNSGIYMMSDELDYKAIRSGIKEQKVLFYESGFESDVIVFKKRNQKYITVGGKPVSNSVLDRNTQFMLGHLPMLTADSAGCVLVIGLGSGVTAGDVSLYDPGVLDAVEISGGVVKASKYFSKLNNDILNSDRFRIFIEDGSFYVRNSSEKYDIIISQPSNPWVPGASMLFTQEFFTACRERLTEGGIMANWYQLYGTDKEDLASEIATFTRVFDDVTIWSYLPGDIIMLGRKRSGRFDISVMKKRFEVEDVRRRLKEIRINDIADVFSGFICEGRDVIKGEGEMNIVRDDRNFLEYDLARSFFSGGALDNFRFLLSKRKNAVPERMLSYEDETTIGDLYADIAESYLKKGIYYKVKELLIEARLRSPENAKCIDLLGDMYFRGKDYKKAKEVWTENLDLGNEEYAKKAIRKIKKADEQLTKNKE